ncbi:B12-binding domain-containing radical SAM protein [Planctomycetota bacterium]
MKIVLISNPVTHKQKPNFPPPGIAYLGAIAHKAGHNISLIDGGLRSLSQITKSISQSAPDLIGLTCWTIDRGMVWKLCDSIKQAAPDAFLVLGGPHATIFPEHIFKKTHASAVVIGEGEKTFHELITALETGSDLKNVKGLVLRAEDGKPFYTPQRQLVEDINSIPLPYYEGFENFNFANYAGFPALPSPTAAVISSRGCVYDCTYCSSTRFWGRNWRFRSAQSVLDEIAWLIEKHKIKSVYFFDDNFPVNKERAVSICEGIIKNHWNIKWACCSHVKMMNPQLLKAMKASGCVAIDFGVESGSDKILKNINKCQTRADIEKTFAMVHESGILPRAYLMVGSPGEDISTIDETIDLIGRIKPHSSVGASILWLLPGTDVYESAVKNDFIDEKYWLDHDNIPFNLQEHSLAELRSLTKRLMIGIAMKKPGILPKFQFLLKRLYYKYPALSVFRSMVPKKLR